MVMGDVSWSCVTITANVTCQKEYKIKFHYVNLGTKLLLCAEEASDVINSENRDKSDALRNVKRLCSYNNSFIGHVKLHRILKLLSVNVIIHSSSAAVQSLKGPWPPRTEVC
jgi:hypothetical protein